MHVIPVGVSLLASIDTEYRLPGAVKALDPATFDQTRARVWSLGQEFVAVTELATRTWHLDRLLTVSARTAIEQAAPDLCAEWDSVRVARRARAVPDDGEALVLVASDTDEGHRAAALVAARYAPSLELRYVDDPRTGPAFIEPGVLYLYRVPGLDLRRGKPTDNTWQSIGALGHVIASTAAQASRDRWDVLLHLSGGYKAMVPYLLVMAEGINSVFLAETQNMGARTPTLRAIAVHESTDNLAVDLPIRALQDNLYRKAKEFKEFVGPTGRVDGDRWDALREVSVIERDGRHHRLTALGTILVNVL